MAGRVIGNVLNTGKKAVLSAVQRLIDDQITKQLLPYLATGEFEGEVRSDVVVDEHNNISIINCVLRPSAVDALLAQNELPFHVITASCARIHVQIPWGALTTGDWVLTIKGLAVVVAPKEPEYWSVDDVRTAKEDLINKGFNDLVKRFKALTEKEKKPSLFKQLGRKFVANLRPKIAMEDVHLRFERLGNVALPFSFGFLVSKVNVDTQNEEHGGPQQTRVSTSHMGFYCRTLAMGAATVLPSGYDPESFATEPEPHFGNKPSKGHEKKKEHRASVCLPSPTGDGHGAASSGGGGSGLFSGGGSMGASAHQHASPERTERMEAYRFFSKHAAVAREMRAFVGRVPSWTNADWLLGPLNIAEDGAVADVQPAHKGEPDKFGYEEPLSVMRLRLGRVCVDATEEQLGAFLSITAFRQSYRLWGAYATRRQIDLTHVGRPRRGYAARRYWHVAKDAVVASLPKAKGLRAYNIMLTLEAASRYKSEYAAVLAEASNPESAADVRAARERLSSREPALMRALMHLEDELPAETLAWCRLTSLHNHLKHHKKGGGSRKGGGARSSMLGGGGGAAATGGGTAANATGGSSGFRRLSQIPQAAAGAAAAPSLAPGGLGRLAEAAELTRDHHPDRAAWSNADGGPSERLSAPERLSALSVPERLSENSVYLGEGSAAGSPNNIDREKSVDDELAESLLDKHSGKSVDPRVDAAPAGYVHHVLALHLDEVVLKLLLAPKAQAQAELLGLRTEAVGAGLLTLKLEGLDVCMRTVQHVGKSIHLTVGALEVCEGAVAEGAHEGGLPLLLRVDGDGIGETPDEHLGGRLDHPGDIGAFLARRHEERNGGGLANTLTSLFGGLTTIDNTIASSLGVGGSYKEAKTRSHKAVSHTASLSHKALRSGRLHAIPGLSPAPSPVPGDARERGWSADDGSDPSNSSSTPLCGGCGAGGAAGSSSSASSARALATGSPTHWGEELAPGALSTLHLRQGAPAVRMSALKSSSTTRPHELSLHMGKVDASYYPGFFAQYERFMRVLEGVKHSSVLGGTAIMRTRFSKLTRSVGATLAEKWHTPEKTMMVAFTSVTDLFDMPSSAHACTAHVDGIVLRLFSEKDANEELMTLTLPPLRCARTPRVGAPMPPLQKAEVTLDGTIAIATPVRKKVLARVLQAQHAGTRGNSRMGGRLLSAVYTASNEVATYRERLRRLDKEHEQLSLLFAALRTRAAASVLSPAADHIAPRASSMGVDMTALLEREKREVAARYTQLHPEQGPSAGQAEMAAYLEKLDSVSAQMDEHMKLIQRGKSGGQGDPFATAAKHCRDLVGSVSRRTSTFFDASSHRSWNRRTGADRDTELAEASVAAPEDSAAALAAELSMASGASAGRTRGVGDARRGPRRIGDPAMPSPKNKWCGCLGGGQAPKARNVVVVQQAAPDAIVEETMLRT